MAQAHWSLRPPAEREAEAPPATENPVTQQRLARAIEDKRAAGYELETQTGGQAVMSKPSRWLGIAVPGRRKRELISIDPRGQLTTQAH